MLIRAIVAILPAAVEWFCLLFWAFFVWLFFFFNCSFCGTVGGFIWMFRCLSEVNTAVGTGSACMDILCIALERLLEKVEIRWGFFP